MCMEKKRRGRGIVIAFLTVILIGLIAVAGILFYRRYAPNEEVVSLTDILPGKAPGKNQTAILQDQAYNSSLRGRHLNGEWYLPLEAASAADPKFYDQKSTGELLFTDAKSTTKLKPNEKKIIVDGKEQATDYIPLIQEGDHKFVNVRFMKDRTKAIVGTYEGPDRIVIFDRIGAKQAQVAPDVSIRTLTGIKSPVLRKTKAETVFVFDAIDEWTKIITGDGYIGYVETKYLGEGSTFQGNRKYEGKYTYHGIGKKVILGWNQVTNEVANEIVNTLDAVNQGINVISPTWLSLADNEGNLHSIVSSDYVQKMHAKQIGVWVLVDDFTKGVDLQTVLGNETTRHALIGNLISAVKGVGADGINIDFEHVTPEAAPSYLQFLRELYLETRKEKLILSADNYVPKEYNAHYNPTAQAEVLDYYIIMGYDEHAGNSANAGSVASIGFVTEGIDRTLDSVPKERVINAIPFYTRLWHERPWQAGDTGEPSDDNMKVKADSIGMNQQDEILKKYPGEVNWNEGTKQFYYQASNGGETLKMWMETKESVEEKLKVMKERDLAGVACWKLGLETSDVWPVIRKYME